jgi:predicted dehydrogenase
MGWHHARVLSLLRDAELVGVADPDAERGQLAVEQFGCRWFPSDTDLLAEVEAVCIAVPTLLHHRVGMACLQAGAHVPIEKPIAASQEEAADLIRAAEGAARLLQVGHIERFNPAFRELTKVVANEQVVVLEARRHSPNGDSRQRCVGGAGSDDPRHRSGPGTGGGTGGAAGRGRRS